MVNSGKEIVHESEKGKSFKFNLNTEKKSIYVFFLLAVINWISHFLYFMRFGLYEDDFANIGIYFGINFSQLVNIILDRLSGWIQGHPFAFLPVLFTYIAELLGGFHFLYVIAFIIVTINSFLIYKILKKVFPESSILAISGAIAFSLFPPDTTKLYLLHAFVLQVSMTFFLTATIFYLNNKKVWAYLIIIFSLFTYESPFMLFFGIPFLNLKWDKKFRSEYLKHFIILCSIIVLMFLYRTFAGESRVMEASGDVSGMLTRAITGIFIGPVYNLYLFLRAPVVALRHLMPKSALSWWYYDYIYFFLSGCLVLFIWLFYKIRPDNSANKSIASAENYPDNDNNTVEKEYLKKIRKLFIAGIILFCLGYSVSFTHYIYVPMGRLTSVHLASSFGGSVVFGCVCAIFFFLAEKYRLQKYAVILISVYFTLLTGYNTYAQKEFVESWSYQKSFWSELVNLCPDLKDNTVILSNIPSDKLYVTKNFIFPFQTYWNKLMFKHLYLFPQNWNVPFYQNIDGKPENDINFINNEFVLKSEYFPPTVLKDSNVILITMDKNDNLVRIDSSLTINGKTLKLKPAGENTTNKLQKKKLYDLLIIPK